MVLWWNEYFLPECCLFIYFPGPCLTVPILDLGARCEGIQLKSTHDALISIVKCPTVTDGPMISLPMIQQSVQLVEPAKTHNIEQVGDCLNVFPCFRYDQVRTRQPFLRGRTPGEIQRRMSSDIRATEQASIILLVTALCGQAVAGDNLCMQFIQTVFL